MLEAATELVAMPLRASPLESETELSAPSQLPPALELPDSAPLPSVALEEQAPSARAQQRIIA